MLAPVPGKRAVEQTGNTVLFRENQKIRFSRTASRRKESAILLFFQHRVMLPAAEVLPVPAWRRGQGIKKEKIRPVLHLLQIFAAGQKKILSDGKLSAVPIHGCPSQLNHLKIPDNRGRYPLHPPSVMLDLLADPCPPDGVFKHML